MNNLLASVLMMILLAVPVDWNAAYKHTKVKNSTIELALDVTMIDDEHLFRVYLVDADDVEYYLASAAFYGTKSGVFLFGINTALEKMGHAPSNNARIIVKGAKLNSYKVNLK